jgi:hypothetical protein
LLQNEPSLWLLRMQVALNEINKMITDKNLTTISYNQTRETRQPLDSVSIMIA